MKKINKSEFALLSLLSKKDMSGYDIKQMASKVAAYHWSESNAQIYPILEKLKSVGYVDSYIDEKSGERLKRIYSITNKGLDYLKSWIIEPVKPAQYREEFLIKLSAAELIDPAILISHFKYYEGECSSQLQEIEKIQQSLQMRHSGRRLLYLKMVYDFSKLNLEAKLKWCEENIQTLNKLQ
jgi:DNA-binding PadR family transcriptional regulator